MTAASPDREEATVPVRRIELARVLGARQVAQAALSGRPTPEVLALGVWVDLLHAALGWCDLGRDDASGAGGSRRDRLAVLLLRRLPGGQTLRARVRGP